MAIETKIQVIKSDGTIIENAVWKILPGNIQSGDLFYISSTIDQSILSKIMDSKSRYITIEDLTVSIACKVKETKHNFNVNDKSIESLILLEVMDRAAENIIVLIYGGVPVPGFPSPSS